MPKAPGEAKKGLPTYSNPAALFEWNVAREILIYGSRPANWWNLIFRCGQISRSGPTQRFFPKLFLRWSLKENRTPHRFFFIKRPSIDWNETKTHNMCYCWRCCVFNCSWVICPRWTNAKFAGARSKRPISGFGNRHRENLSVLIIFIVTAAILHLMPAH